MYTIEQIEKQVKKVIAKEKLDDKTTEMFFKLLRTICDSILSQEEEPKTQTAPAMDLDELIKKKMKEEKVTDAKQLSVSWFLKAGFSDVLDSGSDYYKTRNELLAHSKILKAHPNSLDCLLVEV
jgi:hypothetical protein